MIDGPSLIFRAYYGVRSRMRQAREGRPERMAKAEQGDVNAIPPFLDRLARVIGERRPSHVVVAEDWAWRPDWRVELIPGYKSHRVAEPVPTGLAPQIPVIRAILEAIGIDVLGVDEHEAEDVIGSLTRLASGTVEILSGDRDLFALVDGKRVRILYPEKAGLTVIDEDEVSRRYGIPGRRYADFAILRGDPSDGLPGLRGVGSVGAASMIRRYGSIEGLLRERPLREEDREYLASAMRVVGPVADLPIVLPAGYRDRYPVDEALMQSLAGQYGAEESCGRLLERLRAMSTEPGT